jgi:hypothetical protein
LPPFDHVRVRIRADESPDTRVVARGIAKNRRRIFAAPRGQASTEPC